MTFISIYQIQCFNSSICINNNPDCFSVVVIVYRIREVAEKINKYGPQNPQTLQSLKTPVKQIVIGPAHIGLLLEDGRALRVAFTVLTERLDLSKTEPTKG